MLEAAGEELAQALEELRELARGIHPAILTDRGLRPALEALAARAPVPVELVDLPDEPLPAPIEAAAYYVVAESLTNVAKYAQAKHATVRVMRNTGRRRSRWRTTASAEPTRPPGRASAAWPTASRRSTARWSSTAATARARGWRR